eukprot:CAMPEP_0114986170 /NCGR_PEP_ID=MMETSP0216-20121206/8281_1 /TAXON_ID=223996 /ORGANISM="Protocruzia adherens, Strain Boccale" /LENGTH=455 /DNA_ID=CAMNT_0002348583 /DNA_START=255 /DNA_END=1622 /DNA_ORIENTATION=+
MFLSPPAKRIKLRFNSLLKRTQVDVKTEWPELRDRVALMFELSKPEFVGVVYSDEENDLILVNSSIELWESFKIYEFAPLIKYYVIYTEFEPVPAVMSKLETLRRKDSNVTSFFTNNLLNQTLASRNMTFMAQSAIRHLPDETINALTSNIREDQSLMELMENLGGSENSASMMNNVNKSNDNKSEPRAAEEEREMSFFSRNRPAEESSGTPTGSEKSRDISASAIAQNGSAELATSGSSNLNPELFKTEEQVTTKSSTEDSDNDVRPVKKNPLSIHQCDLTQSCGSNDDEEDHSSLIEDDNDDADDEETEDDDGKNEILALSYDSQLETKIKVTPLDNIKWDNFDIRSIVNSTGPTLVQSIITSARVVDQKTQEKSLHDEEEKINLNDPSPKNEVIVDKQSDMKREDIGAPLEDEDDYDITLIKEESCISEFEGEEAIYNRYSFVRKKSSGQDY